MKKYCLALDLKDNVDKINEYKYYHQDIWPEVSKSLKDSGILNAEIYNTGNRLFMIIEVDKTFSFEKKLKMDLENPKVQKWEKLMWNYQQALPHSEKGSKWVLMTKIFDLNK
jgi:L-rhamnose mutarotase